MDYGVRLHEVTPEAMKATTIPLFPLAVVLLPQAHLPLRIFEQRYLRMVRDCARDGKPFGVVAVHHEPGTSDAAPVIATIGTLATIVDFFTTADGLLGIRSVGGARFRVEHTDVQDDGLLLGQVSLLEEVPAMPLPAEFGLLATLVRSLVDHVGAHHADATPAQWDDASWIANRLGEFLPLELKEKQLLLELTEPLPRLRLLLEWLPRFQAD